MLKAYTLSVSLAAIVGLIITTAPLVRSVLEYRSPDSLPSAERPELASLDTFILAHLTGEEKQAFLLGFRRGRLDWPGMYEAAKAQHADAVRQQVESVRRRAGRNVLAYGTLSVLCIGLFVTHFLWARRVLVRERGTQA